jgi:hypothetical protein
MLEYAKTHNVHFNDDDIRTMSERYLLTLVIALYEGQTANKHLADVSDAMKISTSALSNYLAGRGQPGLIQWRDLYRFTNNDLIMRWLRFNWPELFEGGV